MGFGVAMRKSPSVRSGRSLESTSGLWANARNGTGVKIFPLYNYPDAELNCQTYLTASYFIVRPHLTFDTQKVVKAGILAAKLKFYIVGLDAPPDIPLYVLKGAHGDIVEPTIWAEQNAYTDVGGQKPFSDLVLDSWNEISLNSTAISWINSSPLEKKQYEGFGNHGTAHAELYPPYKWCMSFTPMESHSIRSMRLHGKKVGAGCGVVTVNIYAADIDHLPTGDILATGQFDSATLDTFYDWTGHIALGSGANLSAESEYCFELVPAGGNASNKASFWTTTANYYKRGQAASWDGIEWTPYALYDIFFLEYSDEDVGGTRLCFRTAWDLNDVPPTSGQTTKVGFRAYDAILETTLGALGKQRGFELRGSGFRP